jgi:hypothetical protein
MLTAHLSVQQRGAGSTALLSWCLRVAVDQKIQKFHSLHVFIMCTLVVSCRPCNSKPPCFPQSPESVGSIVHLSVCEASDILNCDIGGFVWFLEHCDIFSTGLRQSICALDVQWCAWIRSGASKRPRTVSGQSAYAARRLAVFPLSP